MATYSVLSGRLVCTGTDITTQGICDAVNANSGSLTPVSGEPASATFFSSDTDYVNAIIKAEISIGNDSDASLWVIESQNVFIQADSFLQNKGDLLIGQKRANGTVSYGSRFVFDSTDNGSVPLSWQKWQLNNGSWIRAYNSIINSDSLLTTPPDFGGIMFDGCYISVSDGIGDGGPYTNLPYAGQTITYKNCVFDAHVGVGLKLYMGHVNLGITYVLENNSVTNNTYGIQPGSAPLVLTDFKLDTNNFHSVPNIGACDVTFINPDFENLRTQAAEDGDIHRLAYRYNYTALGVDIQPISGIKVRIYDQQGNAVVNNLLTDSNGKVAIPTYNNIPVLLRKTYSGATQTVRQAHSFGSIGYLHSIIAKTIQVTEDIVDTNIYTIDFSITQTTKATVDAYTTLETPQKLYDRAKSWLVDNYTGQSATLVSRSGTLIDAGSYNVTIDATAASAFAFDGSTITIKASTYTGDMTTTGVITLSNGATFIGTRTDANGTVAPPKTVSITGITAGSRLQIYNVTTDAEVVNTTVAGTSYTATYEEGTGYNEGDTVRVRLTYVSGTSAKSEFQGSAIVGSTGWSLLVDQVDNTVYNSFEVDGSTITQFQADYLADQVDVITGVNFNISQFYAWWVYNLTTENGIRDFFGGITALDEANIRINTGVLSLYLDNSTSTNIRQLDNRRFFRSDGAYPVLDPTTGGGGIDVVWRNQILIAETGVSGLTSQESLLLNDIANLATTTQLNSAVSGLATLSSINALNNISANDVLTQASAALTAYDAPTKLELDAAQTSIESNIAALNNISTTDIRTELSTELANIDTSISSRLAAADYTAPDNAGITAIKAKTDSLTFTGTNLHAITKVIEDKTGYSLTATEREAIANRVEQSILDESDGQKILEAIVNSIGNENIDQVALVAAIRADLERAGGSLDNLPTLAEIESSSLAKETTVSSAQSSIEGNIAALNNVSIDQVQTAAANALTAYDAPTKAELDTAQSSIEGNIAALNNISTSDVETAAGNALATYDAPTKAELDAAQTSIESDIAALNNISTADVLTQASAALTAYDAPTKAELDSAVSGLATRDELVVINDGIKDASLFIPHTDNI